jgi:hypothetical protein
MLLGAFRGVEVHRAGQLIDEPADHGHVAGPDVAPAPSRGRRGQPRRRHLAGQPATRPQIGGLAAGDAQRVGQGV